MQNLHELANIEYSVKIGHLSVGRCFLKHLRLQKLFFGTVLRATNDCLAMQLNSIVSKRVCAVRSSACISQGTTHLGSLQ